MKKLLRALAVLLLISGKIYSTNYIGNPSNYTGLVSSLLPGDVLYLQPGNYTSNMSLIGIVGTASQRITITGDSTAFNTIFTAQPCCNTVQITDAAYITIKNIKLNGNHEDVDGIKAGGGVANFAHHITIENMQIIDYDNGVNGNVGISTKITTWDWIIRHNSIINAGTGMYLGNSDGSMPFINGLIENNLIIDCKGYDTQIKQQNDGLRTFSGMTLNGKTIIRYNVFSKGANSLFGGSARPCLLVDHFPTTGNGANDYYEIYGNLFYNNPAEGLLQITGTVNVYDNILINHDDPTGNFTMYVATHNGFQNRDIKIFHNTIWTNTSYGGIYMDPPNTNFQQYCYGNAIFSKTAPITGFITANSVDNITDTYANATNYVVSASTTLSNCNMYPKAGQLTGSATSSSLFTSYVNYNKDFNGDNYNWTYRGAYSGNTTNNGWHLQMAIREMPSGVTGINERGENDILGVLYPNPVTNKANLELNLDKPVNSMLLNICDVNGKVVHSQKLTDLQKGPTTTTIDFENFSKGIYILQLKSENNLVTKKILLQ